MTEQTNYMQDQITVEKLAQTVFKQNHGSTIFF